MQYINIPAGTTFPLVLGDDINAMNTAKIYLLCDTSSGIGAINILLPKITIPAGGSIKNWWFEIFVNDIGNNASVNNIKITPSPVSGGDKINGSTSQITLSTNSATGRIVITGTDSWDFNIGNGSSGSATGWIYAGRFNFQQFKDSLDQPFDYQSIIDIATIPKGNTVDEIAFQVVGAFSGTNISQINLDSIGSVSDGQGGFGGFGGISPLGLVINRNVSTPFGTFDLLNDWKLRARLNVFDGELTGLISNLSAGNIDIWYMKEKLPPVV